MAPPPAKKPFFNPPRKKKPPKKTLFKSSLKFVSPIPPPEKKKRLFFFFFWGDSSSFFPRPPPIKKFGKRKTAALPKALFPRTFSPFSFPHAQRLKPPFFLKKSPLFFFFPVSPWVPVPPTVPPFGPFFKNRLGQMGLRPGGFCFCGNL